MNISNIPAEVYLVALDLMGQDRPANPADAKEVLASAESRVDYSAISIDSGARKSPINAFSAALAMYMSLSGPFAEDDGEFAGMGGFTVQH